MQSYFKGGGVEASGCGLKVEGDDSQGWGAQDSLHPHSNLEFDQSWD